jgi:hypothetical protein
MNITGLDLPVNRLAGAFIAGDWHLKDGIDWASVNILLKHAETVPPEFRNLIINGDYLDAPFLMKNKDDFKKWFKRAEGIVDYFIPNAEEEIESGNNLLDTLQKTFTSIIFVMGNHDWRYLWFKDLIKKTHGEYSENFNITTKLKLHERGIDHVLYNDWLDWGSELSITHGMYHGSTCHKKHYEACRGRNVIFSHVHYYECKSFRVRGDTIYSMSLPAMCRLNPEYIKNSETNWSNGYGLIIMRPDGKFNFNVFNIWDNKLVLPDGKVIKG